MRGYYFSVKIFSTMRCFFEKKISTMSFLIFKKIFFDNEPFPFSKNFSTMSLFSRKSKKIRIFSSFSSFSTKTTHIVNYNMSIHAWTPYIVIYNMSSHHIVNYNMSIHACTPYIVIYNMRTQKYDVIKIPQHKSMTWHKYHNTKV